jgi:hypothetical protein
MRLLIIGDSFSYNNSVDSWVKMLPFSKIDNVSSNGSSQYRIYKKLQSVNLTNYDQIILVHTSPFRIHIDNNILHSNSATHANCDLIYNDVKNSSPSEFKDHVIWWFENVYNLDEAELFYNLMLDKIIKQCESFNTLHISFFENCKNTNIINFNKIWQQYPGSINHLSKEGNQKVAETLRNLLQ